MKNDSKPTTGDIQDSKKDQQKMQPETIVIDMPEVKDIPGQENIIPPKFREMQDVTISSADEEGEGILDDLNSDEEETIDDEADVTPLEKKLLKKSAGHQPTDETADLDKLALDDRDNDGALLNEKGIRQDRSGEDLDIPGSEADDDNEDIGEEDEENNIYSQRD
ncbi:MAG: hypothetical protein ABIQ88_19065 [Chitinophagaceae bacterium]